MAQTFFTNPHSGEAINFRISPELEPSIRYDLKSLIIRHGGKVIPAPMDGCIYLIDPRSYKQRKSKDGFEYMSFTFVRACIEGTKFILTLQEMTSGDGAVPFFMEDYKPVPMFLHQTIDGPSRRALKYAITKHGGRLVREPKDAKIILVEDSEGALHRSLNKAYQATESYVEYAHWVGECIARMKFEPTPQLIVRMSGKQDGVAARHFTAEEDSRLMAYIAKRVPFIQAGGRSGRKIYIELTGTLVHEYPWAATHSWQAWRDHYCKQREDFDSTIERYVDAHPQLRLNYNPRDAYRRKGLPKVYRQLGIPWPPDIDSEVDSSGEDSEESSQPKSRKRRSSRLEIQFPISDDEMDIDNKGPIRPRRRLRRVVPETVGSTDSDDDDNQDDGADVDQQEPDTEASSLSLGHARLDDHQSQFEPIKEGDPKDQAQWAKMNHRKDSDRSSHEPRSALQDSALPGGGSDEAQGEEELAKSSTSGTKRENASSPQPAKRHRTMMSGVPLPNSHHTVSQSHTELVIIHSDSDESEMEGLSAQPPISGLVADGDWAEDPLPDAKLAQKSRQASVNSSRALRSRGPLQNVEALEESRDALSYPAPSRAAAIDHEDVPGPVTRARSRSRARSAVPETREPLIDGKRGGYKGLGPIQE